MDTIWNFLVNFPEALQKVFDNEQSSVNSVSSDKSVGTVQTVVEELLKTDDNSLKDAASAVLQSFSSVTSASDNNSDESVSLYNENKAEFLEKAKSLWLKALEKIPTPIVSVESANKVIKVAKSLVELENFFGTEGTEIKNLAKAINWNRTTTPNEYGQLNAFIDNIHTALKSDNNDEDHPEEVPDGLFEEENEERDEEGKKKMTIQFENGKCTIISWTAAKDLSKQDDVPVVPVADAQKEEEIEFVYDKDKLTETKCKINGMESNFSLQEALKAYKEFSKQPSTLIRTPSETSSISYIASDGFPIERDTTDNNYNRAVRKQNDPDFKIIDFFKMFGEPYDSNKNSGKKTPTTLNSNLNNLHNMYLQLKKNVTSISLPLTTNEGGVSFDGGEFTPSYLKKIFNYLHLYAKTVVRQNLFLHVLGINLISAKFVIEDENMFNKVKDVYEKLYFSEKTTPVLFTELFPYIPSNPSDKSQNSSTGSSKTYLVYDNGITMYDLFATAKITPPVYGKAIHNVNPTSYDHMRVFMNANNKLFRIDQFLFILATTFGNYSEDYDKPYLQSYNPIITLAENMTEYLISIYEWFFIKKEGNESLYEQTKTENLSDIERFHATSVNIGTFLTIRCDNYHIPDDINPRYKIDVPESRAASVMNFEYSANPDKISTGQQYSNKFMFGPLTKVFFPNPHYESQAEQISQSPEFTQEIVKKLLDNEPVCIIGYGTSGSGKTSLLIKRELKEGESKDKNTDGIVVKISNALAKKGYTQCDVTFTEFSNEPEKSSPNKTFEYKDEKWIMSSAEAPTKSTPQLTKGKDNGPMDMGDGFLKMLKNRKVEATPNNPVSSRSHVIFDIKYKKLSGDDTVQLILCDFAGVENKFDCTSNEVLNTFASIKDPKTGKLVYENKLTSGTDKSYKEVKTTINDTIVAMKRNFVNPSTMEKDKKGLDILKTKLDTIVDRAQSRISSGDRKETFSKLESLSQTRYGNIQLSQQQVIHLVVAFERIRKYFETLRTQAAVQNDNVWKQNQNAWNFIAPATTTEVNFLESLKNPYFQKHINAVAETLRHFENYTDPNTKTKTLSLRSSETVDIPGVRRNRTVNKRIFFKDRLAGKRLILQSFINKLTNKYKKNFPKINEDDYMFQAYCIFLAYHFLSEIFSVSVINNDIGTDYATDFLEYWIEVVDLKTFEKLKEPCNDRVKEGKFINESLKDLRKYIASMVRSDTFPLFQVECLPYQCQVEFKQCFGSDYPTLQELKALTSNDFKALGNKIRTLCGEKTPFFSIFGVVDWTKDVNEPPKSPFIDITDVQIQYQKLSALKLQYYTQNELKSLFKDAIFRIIRNLVPLKLAKFFPLEGDLFVNQQGEVIMYKKQLSPNTSSTSITTNVGSEASATGIVFINLKTGQNITVAEGEQLYPINFYLLQKTIDASTENEIVDKLNGITSKYNALTTDKVDSNMFSNVLGRLDNVVEIINNINALSVVGTIQFVDSMAKYGSTITCNQNVSTESTIPNDKLPEKLEWTWGSIKPRPPPPTPPPTVQVQQVSPPPTPAKPKGTVEPEFIVVDVGNDNRGYNGKMIFPFRKNPTTESNKIELGKTNFNELNTEDPFNIGDISKLSVGDGLTFKKLSNNQKQTNSDLINRMIPAYGSHTKQLEEAKEIWYEKNKPTTIRIAKTARNAANVDQLRQKVLTQRGFPHVGGKYTLKRPRK